MFKIVKINNIAEVKPYCLLTKQIDRRHKQKTKKKVFRENDQNNCNSQYWSNVLSFDQRLVLLKRQNCFDRNFLKKQYVSNYFVF